MLQGGGEYRVEGDKAEDKNWDNCNSVINKIFFKKGLQYKFMESNELVVPKGRGMHFQCRIILICYSQTMRCDRVSSSMVPGVITKLYRHKYVLTVFFSFYVFFGNLLSPTLPPTYFFRGCFNSAGKTSTP